MVQIIKYKKEFLNQCCKIICTTYKEFNFSEGTPDAIEKYILNYTTTPSNKILLAESFSRTPIYYLATDNNKVVGLVRGLNGRVINLFVDKKYHKKGIARKLVKKFEVDNITNGIPLIKIRSSIYAIQFYQKLGYKKTTGIRNFRGLLVQPMKKEFQ